MLIATTLTLAIFWLAGTMLSQLIAHNRDKILAALQGRSWTAQPTVGRPVTVRFSPRYTAVAPARLKAELRAAA